MRAVLNLLLIALLLLPVAGGTGVPPSAARLTAEGPLSLDEYWQRVEDTRQAVSDLEHQPESAARSALEGLAEGWEGPSQVSLPDGTRLALEHSELAALLRQDPPDLAAILGRLETLLALHERFPTGVFTLQDIESLKSILADPRFQWAEAKPSPLVEWWDNLWKKIMDWLNRLFGDMGVGTVTLPAGPGLTWVLAVLLVLVLAFAGRGLLAGLVKDAELAGNGAGEHEVLTSGTALERAEALSRGGDYRSAVRYLYLSALLLLDERGLLRYDRSRTNREVLRSVGDSPALIRPLRAVIDIFDRVWYGFQPIDGQTYQDYVRRVDELKKQKP
jgi:hypothetical protein